MYKDETWSDHLIDKSSLSKHNDNKFTLTVIGIFNNYACFIPLMNKSGKSITIGLKTNLMESSQGGFLDWTTEELWVDRGNEFHNKKFKCFLEENQKVLYSIYSALKAVFIKKLNRSLLLRINKPVFINGEVYNWVNILWCSCKVWQ